MRRQLSLILKLAHKDWRLFWADRRAALLCFGVPIILASAFGAIFDRPRQSCGEVRLPLFLVVEDDSPFTRQIVQDLLACKQLDVQLADRARVEREVRDRAVGVAVIIPEGFGPDVQHSAETLGPILLEMEQATPEEIAEIRAEEPGITLLHHPLSGMESQWAEGVLTEILMRRLAQDYLSSAPIDPPFAVHRATPGSAPARFSSYSHSFAGMTLQYLLFWGMESGLLFLRERQRGIWRRLRASPVSPISVLMGRALATASIAMLMVLTTFGFGWLVFGVSIAGSPLGFLLLAGAVSGLAAAIGLLVATIGATEARARGVCILVILAVSMIGGLWLPSFLLPNWVRDLSLTLPTSWAMRGFDGVTWQHSGLGSVMPCVLMVIGFALGCLTLAVGRFLWIESRRRRGWTI